jgi:hypothetical protein
MVAMEAKAAEWAAKASPNSPVVVVVHWKAEEGVEAMWAL